MKRFKVMVYFAYMVSLFTMIIQPHMLCLIMLWAWGSELNPCAIHVLVNITAVFHEQLYWEWTSFGVIVLKSSYDLWISLREVHNFPYLLTTKPLCTPNLPNYYNLVTLVRLVWNGRVTAQWFSLYRSIDTKLVYSTVSSYN